MKLHHELSVSFNGTLVSDAEVERIVGLEGGDRGGWGRDRDIHFTPPKAMSPTECEALRLRLEHLWGTIADFSVSYEAWPEDEDADSLLYDELTVEQRA